MPHGFTRVDQEPRPEAWVECLDKVHAEPFMKPGATIVVVDPDYGTQAMEFPDRDLAGKVFDFRARQLLRNGTLAGRKRLEVRDPTAVDNVMGLRSWARTAGTRGLLSEAEVERWERLYDGVVADGRFGWSVSFFLTSGRKN